MYLEVMIVTLDPVSIRLLCLSTSDVYRLRSFRVSLADYASECKLASDNQICVNVV